MKTVEAFETIDGKQFFCPKKAKRHEQSLVLETAKCRIFNAFSEASSGTDWESELMDKLGEPMEDVSEISDLTNIIVEIAKFDKDAFVELADEIKKTNLKTYNKDHKLAVENGWITLPLKGVDADEIEYEGTEADLEEE